MLVQADIMTPHYNYYKALDQEGKERYNARSKAWQQANPEKARESVRRWNAANYEQRMLNSAKSRCKVSGLHCDIVHTDIVIPTHCPYLGIELTRISGRGFIESNASLDRIDNTKGYVKGNIQVISRLANMMKQNASEETLVKFAKGVLAVHQGGLGPC